MENRVHRRSFWRWAGVVLLVLVVVLAACIVRTPARHRRGVYQPHGHGHGHGHGRGHGHGHGHGHGR